METTKIKIRRSEERGRNRFEWLDSAHSFSFGGYYDPSNMGFLSLRVINEDWIKGGGGFPPHPHQDMELFIVSSMLQTQRMFILVAADLRRASCRRKRLKSRRRYCPRRCNQR